MDDEIKQKIRASLERILEAEGDQYRRIDTLVKEALGDNDTKRRIIMTFFQVARLTGQVDVMVQMLDGDSVVDMMPHFSAEFRDANERLQHLFDLEAQREEDEG